MSVTEAVMTVMLAITTVAIVALIVSRKGQTPAVIQATASGFANSLAVAEAPVTGAAMSIDLSYPASGLGRSGFLPAMSGPAW